MTPLQMAEAAAKAMAEPGTLGVVMTIPVGKMPPGFPRGELLNEMKRGEVTERTYNFDPHKVIAWLLKNGLIEMARTDERTLSFFEPTTKDAQ
jgi:hypothetical protein